MNNKILLIIVGFVFIGSYFLGKIINTEPQNDPNLKIEKIKSICDPTQKICEVSLSGSLVLYQILGKPSALKKFKVELDAFELPIKNIRVNFLMPGMDMGMNHYSLENKNGSIWTREVILPVCTLSRNDWVNQLEIEHEGQNWIIEFSFVQRN